MPGHLAGPISILGRHFRYEAAGAFRLGPFKLGPVIVVLIGIVVFVGLLALPVLWDILFGAFTVAASKIAPGTFLLGLGVLLAGLVLGVGIVELVGACLMGAVVLGVIWVNYLMPTRRRSRAGRARPRPAAAAARRRAACPRGFRLPSAPALPVSLADRSRRAAGAQRRHAGA